MVDIHCHLLPSLDDGPRDMLETLELAAALLADGVETVVATPHALYGTYDAPEARVRAVYEEVREEIARQGLRLRLELGREKSVTDIDPTDLDGLRACTITPSRRYLLVETSLHEPPPRLPDMLFRIALQGLRPIIVHPERVLAFQQDFRAFEPLARQEILAAVDAGSLLGHHGRRAERTARLLAERGWAQFVASDAHGPSRRYHSLREARDVLAGAYGVEAAERLTSSNPAAVLTGEDVAQMPLRSLRPR